MATIQVSGAIRPKTLNTPVDERTRVASVAEISNIRKPFVGMLIYCTGDGKYYKVTALNADEDAVAESGYEPLEDGLDYEQLDNKPTISDGGQGSAQIPLSGNVKVTASTASGSTAGVTVTPGQNTGEIEMNFTLPKGADGQNGAKGDTGEQGPAGPQGAQGISAFEVWKETTNRPTATEAEYIADLQTKVVRWIPVAYEATAASASIGDTVTFTTAPSNPIDGAIVLMPNNDAATGTGNPTATMMFSVSVSDDPTPVTTYTYIGDMNVDTTGLLGSGDVDGTGLKNPTSSQVAKATDVMPLAAKLEGVTAVEDKLTVEDETTGYINFNNTTGSASSYKWGKFDVQGYRRVRFKGYVRGNGYSTPGYCFVDEDNNWMDGYAYEFFTDNVPSVQKEYEVAVPKGAVYLKTNTVAGDNMSASDFYCYGLKGESVIDVVNGSYEIVIGENQTLKEKDGNKYLAILPNSPTEYVFFDEGSLSIKTKYIIIGKDWKQLRVWGKDVNGVSTNVIFLKKEYTGGTITFTELQQGGYICDGIETYAEMFNLVEQNRLEHINIPSDAAVAYIQRLIYQGSTDRLPQSVVPIRVEHHTGSAEVSNSGSVGVYLRLGMVAPEGGLKTVLKDERVALKSMVSNPYKLNGCKITAIDGVKEGETLKIHKYSEDNAYLGYTTGVDAVGQDKLCEYVLLELSSVDAYAHSTRELTISFSGSEKIEKTYWGRYRTDPYWITFEVERLCAVEPATAAYSGRTQRVYTTGYVILPPNYDRDGEPVPLAMFIHGTGGYTYGESAIAYYTDLLKFVAKNGYAVVDCCTMGNIYSATTDLDGTTRTGYKDVNYPCHLSVDCYVSLYKYATEMFNIDKDRVFVWGKSSGGRLATVLAQNKLLPIKAVGVLNGGLDTLTNFRVLGYDSLVAVKKLMEDDMGFTNIPSSFLVSDQPYRDPSAIPSALIDYLLANVDKIAGFNPLFTGVSNFDIDTYERAQFACSMAASAMRTSMTNNATLMAQVNGGFKTSLVPTKIWAAEDDENVPYPMAVIYTKLVKRGGGICELRTIPAGNGKHWAVDIAPNIPAGYGTVNPAPKTSYVTKFGEEVAEVTVTYAELVDWFNQW